MHACMHACENSRDPAAYTAQPKISHTIAPGHHFHRCDGSFHSSKLCRRRPLCPRARHRRLSHRVVTHMIRRCLEAAACCDVGVQPGVEGGGGDRQGGGVGGCCSARLIIIIIKYVCKSASQVLTDSRPSRKKWNCRSLKDTFSGQCRFHGCT